MSERSLEPDRCAEKLKALGDPIRLRIVNQLRPGPMNVTELSTAIGSEVVTVSHHLGILHQAGIVQKEKHGRFVSYRLHDDVFHPGRSAQRSEHIDLGCCRLEIPKN